MFLHAGPGSSICWSVVMTYRSVMMFLQSILVSLHVAQLGDVSMTVFMVTYFMHTSFNYLYVMYLLSHSVLVTCDITP